jgi:hypothetical protein
LFGPGSSKGSFARVIRWTEVGGLAGAGEVSGIFLWGVRISLAEARLRPGVHLEGLTLCRHEMESGVDVAKQLLKSKRIDGHTTMVLVLARCANRSNSETVRNSISRFTRRQSSRQRVAPLKLAHRHRHGICVCLDGRFLEPGVGSDRVRNRADSSATAESCKAKQCRRAWHNVKSYLLSQLAASTGFSLNKLEWSETPQLSPSETPSGVTRTLASLHSAVSAQHFGAGRKSKAVSLGTVTPAEVSRSDTAPFCRPACLQAPACDQ